MESEMFIAAIEKIAHAALAAKQSAENPKTSVAAVSIQYAICGANCRAIVALKDFAQQSYQIDVSAIAKQMGVDLNWGQ